MFLRINGHQIYVQNATPKRHVTKAGRRDRSFRGQMRDARRHVRRSWDMEAVILEEEDATALKGLLWGLGHQMDFATGFQGSTGLNPVPGWGTALRVNAQAWGANGQGVLQSPALIGRLLAYDAQLRDDEWTILWGTYNASAGWFGNAKRSDGMGYRQGVRDDNTGELVGSPDGTYVNVVDGVAELGSNGGTLKNIDDLILLPYKMTPTMMASVSNPVANGKFGPCPALLVTGDIFAGQTAVCVAEVTGVKFTGRPSVVPNLGWVSNAQVVSFTLMELDPGFVAGVLNKNIATPKPPGAPVWWFDAGDIDLQLNLGIAPYASIASWSDKGSRAQNATQGVGANQPTLRRIAEPGRIKDMPAVLFDGVNDTILTSTGAGLVGAMTVACVFRFNVIGVDAYPYDGVDGAGRLFIRQRVATVYEAGRGLVTTPHTVIPVVGDWAFSIMRYDGATSLWRINGTDFVPSSPGVQSPKGMTLGSGIPAAGGFLNGYVVEVIAWNDGTISLDTIEAYLEARYGLLPQT